MPPRSRWPVVIGGAVRPATAAAALLGRSQPQPPGTEPSTPPSAPILLPPRPRRRRPGPSPRFAAGRLGSLGRHPRARGPRRLSVDGPGQRRLVLGSAGDDGDASTETAPVLGTSRRHAHLVRVVPSRELLRCLARRQVGHGPEAPVTCMVLPKNCSSMRTAPKHLARRCSLPQRGEPLRSERQSLAYALGVTRLTLRPRLLLESSGSTTLRYLRAMGLGVEAGAAAQLGAHGIRCRICPSSAT